MIKIYLDVGLRRKKKEKKKGVFKSITAEVTATASKRLSHTSRVRIVFHNPLR